MKAITIKNPWAYLVAAGIKDIENRTWPTKYRGRVLIHASAKPVPMKHEADVFTYTQWWNGLTLDQRILMQSNTLANSAIIGSVEIVGYTLNHESVWAEKTDIQRASKVRSTKGLMVYVFGRLAAAYIALIFNS